MTSFRPSFWERVRIDGPTYVLLACTAFSMWEMFDNGGKFWLVATIVCAALAVVAQTVSFQIWKRKLHRNISGKR